MKRYDNFGDYMFDLLFAPLKKGKEAANQFRIFFRVIGKDFDDVKKAFFRVRDEANVVSASPVMLPVHGQDRDMPRLEGEDIEAYRTRLSMKGLISEWGGTRQGVLYALTSLGYDKSYIEPFSVQDPERWAEFIIFLKSSKQSGVYNLDVIGGLVTHASILTSAPSTAGRPAASPVAESSPTTERSVRRFGASLSPVNCRRMSTRPSELLRTL